MEQLYKNNFLSSSYLIFLGALSSFSLPPYNYFLINFITFSLFFIYLFKKKKLINSNYKFLYGWLFGFGYFLSNLYWISFSLKFDENFKFLIPFALILIPHLYENNIQKNDLLLRISKYPFHNNKIISCLLSKTK